MGEPGADDGSGRLGDLPGRVRGVSGRLLRQPTTMLEQFAELHERLDSMRLESTEASAALAQQLAELRDEVRDLQAALADRDATSGAAQDRIGSTLAALVTQAGAGAAEPLTSGPLVSIVLPVRDRPAQLVTAVASVRAQTYQTWELLVVDDGSQPPAADALGALAEDDRVRVLRAGGVGVAAARNQAIAASQGELVTFLDSDNWWFPGRLEAAVRGMPPERGWGFDQQLVIDTGHLPHHVRDTALPLAELALANFIDVGVVVVRRRLLDELGPEPFDESLPRLSDWDLVLRLADVSNPVRLSTVGQAYDTTGTDRISATEPYGPAYHRIRARVIGAPATGLRVLVSAWHFPQVTEAYMQSDIAGLARLGAEVEVWSDEDVAVPYDPGVPWHRGSLEDHIERFRPHLVLTHWLNIGRTHREVTRPLGLPHAVRCHGFDYDPGLVDDLADDPGVVVHLFPHLASRHANRPNVTTDVVAFDPDRIGPADGQDRRMVLRLVAGLHTKDLETFLLAARRCPEHRFVLGVAHAYGEERITDELCELARRLESPAEIRIDLGYEEAAELTMRSGIYVHTHGVTHSLGMPISPVEAMASGSLVLARHLRGSDYVAAGGLRYDGADPHQRAAHVAALVNDTLTWSDERWAAQRRAALDAAWSRHPADLVANELLATWQERFALLPD